MAILKWINFKKNVPLLTTKWFGQRIYKVCPEGTQPCNMKNIYWGRYKTKETLYIRQWWLSSLQSRHLGRIRPHPILPITISCSIVFSWISLTAWNLFLFKGDFSFGKSQKLLGIKSGLWGDWVTWVICCFTKKHCMRHDAWEGILLWWSCP